MPSLMSSDEIIIRGLLLPVSIGVPDAERAVPQTLEADVLMRLPARCEDLGDEVARTIDYEAVAGRIREIAASRPRKLIETLAADIAACVIGEFRAASVVVEIRKRILPQTDHVAVRIERCAL